MTNCILVVVWRLQTFTVENCFRFSGSYLRRLKTIFFDDKDWTLQHLRFSQASSFIHTSILLLLTEPLQTTPPPHPPTTHTPPPTAGSRPSPLPADVPPWNHNITESEAPRWHTINQWRDFSGMTSNSVLVTLGSWVHTHYRPFKQTVIVKKCSSFLTPLNAVNTSVWWLLHANAGTHILWLLLHCAKICRPASKREIVL